MPLYYGTQGWRPLNAEHHTRVGRNFNWIWYVGAGVWFLNAALAMHHGKLRSGLANAAIAAAFLAAGILLGRLTRREPPGRNSQR